MQSWWSWCWLQTWHSYSLIFDIYYLLFVELFPHLNTWLLQREFVHPYFTKAFKSSKWSCKFTSAAAGGSRLLSSFTWWSTTNIQVWWEHFLVSAHLNGSILNVTVSVAWDKSILMKYLSPVYLFLGSIFRCSLIRNELIHIFFKYSIFPLL